jgi:hypothetical protein
MYMCIYIYICVNIWIHTYMYIYILHSVWGLSVLGDMDRPVGQNPDDLRVMDPDKVGVELPDKSSGDSRPDRGKLL